MLLEYTMVNFFYSIYKFCIWNEGGEGKCPQCRRLFLGGGGHFAEMPTDADRRGVGVKNRENLPMS